MMKLILIVLLSAAFFHVANSDIECFYTKIMAKLLNFKPDASSLGNVCQEYEDTFTGIRKEIKECDVNKVKVDGLESLVEDFCSKDDIKQEFLKKQNCLERNSLGLMTCVPQPETPGNLKEGLKSQCNNRKTMLDCINKGLGKPCDAEILVKRVTDAFESALVGWCAEVDGASVNKVFTWSLISCVLFVIMFWKERI